MAYGKRQNPAKKAEERMTRADSLQSIQRYGKVVPKSQQAVPAVRKVGIHEAILRPLKKALSKGKK